MNVATVACDLCGVDARYPIEGEDGRRFCCAACVEVDRLLRNGPAQAAAESPSEADVEMVTLSLGGMWCSSCSWAIEETLDRTPGVETSEVSFVRREARVSYDATRTSPSRLKKRVRRLGYRAWLPGERIKDEEDSLYYRMLIGFVLTMNVMMISLSIYASEWLGWWSSTGSADIRSFLELVLFVGALPVVLLLGLPILKAGVVSLARGKPNIHTLIAIGSFSAFGLSVRNLAIGADRLYFDTATVLLLLVTFGHWLELRARKRGAEAVDKLWERLPGQATVITEDGTTRIMADEVALGSRVLVRPGETFPVDGFVASGTGAIDKSLLTGESMPETTAAGDEVHAGTISVDGAFEVITSAVGSATAAGQIGRLLHDALWLRAPINRLADRVAAAMVPVATVISLVTFFFWTAQSGHEVGLLNALAVLLIACPCALGIATPLTTWLAVGRAADSGVITRGFAAIEELATVRVAAFDKTGTLTRRPMRVSAVHVVHGSASRLIALAAAVEARSGHPAAEAILDKAVESNINIEECESFEVHPGMGVSGRVDGRIVAVGSAALMIDRGPGPGDEVVRLANEIETRGAGVVYVAVDEQVAGVIEIDERVRDEIGATFERLGDDGIEVMILTGDTEMAGRRWSDTYNVPVRAGMTPSEKSSLISASQSPVIMIGDGINDAPSLAAAAVGISVSEASDVARSAADIVVLPDDLLAVPWLVGLSRTAMRKVRQNLTWAFGYNLVGIGLAAAGLLPPVVAAGLMVLSSVVVTANASRLRRYPSLADSRAPSG